MKIITLQFTKLLAERFSQLKDASITTQINFTNVEKDSLSILKENNLMKISFNYSLAYSRKQKSKEPEEKEAEISFHGFVLVSVSEDEQKEFENSWKKNHLPQMYFEVLFNLILRRCSIKAIPLQEELGVPSPFVRIPPVKVKNQNK